MSAFEDGQYFGKLIEAQTSESSNGTPQIVLKFDLLSGDGQPTGSMVTAYEYLSDKAMPGTMEKLMRLGFNKDFDNPEFDPVLSAKVSLDAKSEEYQGKISQKWRIGFTPAKAKSDVIARLNAQARNFTSTAPKPAGSPARPASPAKPSAAPARPTPTNAATEAFGPRTMDDAWQAWTEAAKRGDGPDESIRFWAAIDKVAAQCGKKDDQFGPAEWKAVVDQHPPI